MYDSNCNQLVRGIKKHPKCFRKTKYYEIFKDFDGSTGYHLVSKLNNSERLYLMGIAENLIKMREENKI